MEFISKNGAKVVVNPADFKSAMELKSAISKEVSKSDFSFVGVKSLKDIDMAEFLKLAMTVDSSDLVQDALFKCLSRCTYKGHKITFDLFDDVEIRKDYYEIVIACLKENLTPFFEGLISKLQKLLEKLPNQAEEDQK